MLKTWGLTNFKSIYNMEKDLEFAPLTVLTGTNSSGKSAFIQSILLIAQTMQNKFPERALVLNGDFVDLGQFDDIRSRPKPDSGDKHLLIGIRFNCECEGNIPRRQFILDNSISKDKEFLAKAELEDKIFEYEEYMESNGESKDSIDDELEEMMYKEQYLISFDLEFDSLHNEQFSPRIISIKQKILNLKQDEECTRSLHAKEDSTLINDKIEQDANETAYQLLKTDYDPVLGEFGSGDFLCHVRVVHFWPERIDITNKLKKHFPEKDAWHKNQYNKYFEACYREFGDFFSGFKYLGPLRYRESYYPFSKASDPKDVGVKGEYTAAVFDVYKSKKVDYILPEFFNDIATENIETVEKPLNEALKDWFDYFGMDENIVSEITRHGYLLMSNKINISHVGTGVSQVLPILITCLLADKGSTLLFEQPELHLHPRVQSRLADFFLSMALCEKQCIIETHSEYFIDKLRLRICQTYLNDNDKVKKNTKIYYFDKNEAETKITEIDVNEYGDYSTWPAGFFDERQYNNEDILSTLNERLLIQNNKNDMDNSDD